MNDEIQPQPQEATITLEGEDGQVYSCQILDIFEFEKQEYALLLKAGDKEAKREENSKEETNEDDEGALVIMRLVQRDEQSIFQTIESDEEFERVVQHVEELARQSQEVTHSG